MKKNLTIAVLVGAVLAAGGFWVTQPTVQQIIDRGGDNLGALAGPDIPSPYLKWGGVARYSGSIPFQTATNTVCAIQSPAATSTLQSVVLRFDVSSTTASAVEIAKASTRFATTTLLDLQYPIAANAQTYISASSTIANRPNWIFEPNYWVVVKMEGGATHVMSPEGICQASWESS